MLVKTQAAAIDRRWPEAEGLEPEADPDFILNELHRRWRAKDWQSYTWADLQRAARVLFGTLQQHEQRAGTPAEPYYRQPSFRDLVQFVIDQVATGAKRRFVRTMYHLYLSTFDASGRHTKALAARLERHHRGFDLRITGAVRLGVLAPRTAVKGVVHHMTQEASPFKFLRTVGIRAPHGEGLMALVHQEFVRRHRPAEIRRDPASSERLLNWVSPPDEAQPMDAGAELGIDALLLPWKDVEPPKELRERLQNALLQGFGDPRMSQAGVWGRCSEDALAVLRSWLAQVTIEVFFEIISKVVTSHMWQDRKGLWMDRVKRREITDACFALSPRGAAEAKRLRLKGGVALKYANNVSRSSQDREKCLLLMKVNDRIVVEGSHSFKTHIYRRGDSRSVRFHRRSYTCEQFRADGDAWKAEAIVHHQRWADRVRNVLDG